MALTSRRQKGACKKIFKTAFLIFFLFFTVNAFGQNSGGATLASEITALEKKLDDTRLSAAERKKSLVELARLLELSGEAERAARIWNEAALAVPGKRDGDALLHSAVCLAAIGEFDKASGAVEAAIAAARQESGIAARTLRTKAAYVGAQIDALRTGKTSELKKLAADRDFAVYRPGIYYTVWRIAGDDSYRTKLVKEFPQSPEARIALENGKDNPSVSAAPTALWLLMGVQAAPVVSAAENNSTAPDKEEPPPDAGDAPYMLQTGLFSKEENARALMERLRAAGFTPLIGEKKVNGKKLWAVGVAPGNDYSDTMLRLNDKGFEAFPVFE